MAYWYNDPGQLSLADNTAITTGNSAAPGAWSSVWTSTGGSATFDSPDKDYVLTTPAQLRRSISSTRVAVEVMFEDLGAAPTTQVRLIEVRYNADANYAVKVTRLTDGKVRVENRANSNVHTTTAAMPTTGRVRFYLGVETGASTNDGELHFRYYTGSSGRSTTADEAGLDSTTADVGTGNLTSVYIGGGSGGPQVYRIPAGEGVQIDDTTYAVLGPLAAASAPVVTLGAARTVEPMSTVNLTATHVSGSTEDAWSWAVVSDPSGDVALSGTGASRSFTGPSTVDGVTVRIGCTASTSGTPGPQAIVDVTALPQPWWVGTVPASPAQV